MVEVTQADKRQKVTEADRRLWCEMEDLDGAWAKHAMSGKQDNAVGLQLIAKFRIAVEEAAILEGVRIGLEAGAQQCDQQKQDFLSPDYSTGQPLSTLMERFACDECAREVRALDPAQVLAAHRAGGGG